MPTAAAGFGLPLRIELAGGRGADEQGREVHAAALRDHFPDSPLHLVPELRGQRRPINDLCRHRGDYTGDAPRLYLPPPPRLAGRIVSVLVLALVLSLAVVVAFPPCVPRVAHRAELFLQLPQLLVETSPPGR